MKRYLLPLRKGDKKDWFKKEDRPLTIIHCRRRADLFEFLVWQGADWHNSVNEKGYNPLHAAASAPAARIPIVTACLAAGISLPTVAYLGESN